MTAAEKGNGTDSSATPGPFSDAANRIRDSAKYLLAAFAAVGALLAAGLQLSDLGALAPDRADHRLQWAIGGVAAAVAGIALAIGSATAVVSRSFVTLQWLTKWNRGKRYDLDGDEALLATTSTVRKLYDSFAEALKEQRVAIEQTPPDAEAAAVAHIKVQYHDRIAMRVIQQASYRRLRRGYTFARVGMLVGALLAALGISIFAWAANPPANSQVPVVIKTPTMVQLTLTASGQSRLQGQLGQQCDLTKPLSAVAVRDIGDSYELALTETSECKSALITVEPTDGTVSLDQAEPATSGK